MAVACDQNLRSGMDERVKSMQKLLLCPLLVGEEVEVVQNQDIELAITLSKPLHAVVLEAGDEMGEKSFAVDALDGEVGLVGS